MQVMLRIVCCLLVISLSSACFLNSCPYRRYGRTLRCTSCGPDNAGICMGDGRCCSTTACISSSECLPGNVCPEKFCKIGKIPGFCLTRALCCTTQQCLKSIQCL